MRHPYRKVSRKLAQHNGSSLASLTSSRGGMLGVLLAGIGAGLLFKLIFADLAKPKGLTGAARQTRDVHLSSSIYINRPARDIYDFWKNFSNLPRIMSFLEAVEPREGKITHWVARAPGAPPLEWDSEVVDEVPPYQLSWRSLEGSDIQTWGSVVFEPRADSNVTEVSVSLNFNPPGGAAGSAAAHFLKGLESSVLEKNLRKLKAYMEMGEMPMSKQVPHKGVKKSL